MRGLWICQRMLRPSSFQCILLLLGASLLTLSTLFIDKSADLGSDVTFQRNAKIINFNDVQKRSSLFSAQHQQALDHDSANQDNYVTVHENDVIHIAEKYNQNYKIVLNRKYIPKDTQVQLSTSDHGFFKHNSQNIVQKSLNVSTFDQDNTQTLEKLKSTLIALLDYKNPVHQREIISYIITHYTDSPQDREKLLSLISRDISKFESSLVVHILDRILKNTTFTNELKSQYVDLFKQILENNKGPNTFNQTAYEDNVTNNGKVHNIPQNFNYKSHNDKVILNPLNKNTENLLLPPARNKDFILGHSDVVKVGLNSSLFKVPHTKRRLIFWRKNNGLPRPNEKVTPYTFTRVVDGIFWSDDVENRIPKGVSNQDADKWMAKSRLMKFKFLQSSSWKKCGRPKNAFAQLIDGSEACVRYRSPHDRLVQGEIMSYWLARLLSLDNVPPVYLSYLNSSQWSRQQHRFQGLGWAAENYVAALMWITEIDSRPEAHVFMPRLMLQAYKQNWSINESSWSLHSIELDTNMTQQHSRQPSNDLLEEIALAQWGSMIIFDYLTGNYDRVASMQDGAEQEKNPGIIEEPIRNLRKSKNSRKIWLIDNESGLFDGYEMLYQSKLNGQRFLTFHKRMLQTMCVFQRRVVQGLRDLYHKDKSHKILELHSQIKEPLLKFIEKDSSYEIFEKFFSRRLERVLKWINYCENKARQG